MDARIKIAALAGLVLLTAVAPDHAAAQESIGFADADDIQALLEYRLPDWGYRTWDATFDVNGTGMDVSDKGESLIQAQNRGMLGSRLVWRNFGEQRDWSTSARLDGSYDRSRWSDGTWEHRSDNLQGLGSLDGEVIEYLGGGPFSVGALLLGSAEYQEYDAFHATADTTTDDTEYRRANRFGFQPTVGIGRVRDVTPVIRAKRLSERLVALGRPPLTAGQVRQVAAVLAREYGYRTVYERPDRHFWRDVLEPMLDPARPLSPFEIYYLRDVMQEDIGPRLQGRRLEFGLGYTEDFVQVSGEGWKRVERDVSVKATVAWNPSLNRQVDVSVGGRWGNEGRVYGQTDLGRLFLNLGYDWILADRCRLDSAARADYTYRESDMGGIQRNLLAGFDSRLRFRVEDQVHIVARLGLGFNEWNGTGLGGGLDTIQLNGWEWSYGLGLEYALDRLLY